MKVNELPTDVLEQIFYMHVYIYRQSRVPLLRTCRKWNIVARNHGLLWRSITLWAAQTLVPVNVDCYNLRGLANVINMTGTATFDLGLGCPFLDPTDAEIQRFVDSVDKNWLSRCRSFTLWAPEEPWRVPDTRTLGDLLRRYSYDSLETLQLEHTGTIMWGHMLEALMDRVETTSPRLRSLKVGSGMAVKEIAQNVLERPRVLGRIQTLDISSIQHSIPWSDFENLQNLRVSRMSMANLSDLTNLTAPLLTRLHLEGNFQPHSIPSAILPQITHLTLDWFEVDKRSSTDSPLSLPSLISLTFLCTSFELACLDAPKLEEFVFTLDAYDQRPYRYPLFKGSTSSPRVMRLDILSNEVDEEFSDPLPMWRRVEELHLTIYKGVPLKGTEFMDIICGDYYDHLFPTLRHLTILHPSDRLDEGPSADEKKGKMDEARGIMKARIAEGLKPFERLEVGWYWTNNNEYVLEDQSREWWVTTTWEDCLQK